jgi:hypothetical protein
MLYKEIIAVCSQIHAQHINILCGQKAEFLNPNTVALEVTTGLWMVKVYWRISQGCMHLYSTPNVRPSSFLKRLTTTLNQRSWAHLMFVPREV